MSIWDNIVGGARIRYVSFRVITGFDPVLWGGKANPLVGTEVTYQLINIPTSALAALRRVGQALVRPEMPIQMTSLFFSAFICDEEALAAGHTLIRLGFI